MWHCGWVLANAMKKDFFISFFLCLLTFLAPDAHSLGLNVLPSLATFLVVVFSHMKSSFYPPLYSLWIYNTLSLKRLPMFGQSLSLKFYQCWTILLKLELSKCSEECHISYEKVMCINKLQKWQIYIWCSEFKHLFV